MLTAQDLTSVAAFADLPPETLEWLAQHGEVRDFTAGTEIFRPGDPAQYLTAMLHGGMQFYAVRNGQREPGFRQEAGQVSGVLPYSRLREIKGYGVAIGDTRLYLLDRDKFPELERQSPELVQRLVGLMSDRARLEARTQERDEKLRALGKLSAGLAHELNNPAAAIVRGAETLNHSLLRLPELLLELVGHCPDPASIGALTQLAAAPVPERATLSPLERADQEDALAEWLEEQQVPDGYQLASGLLDAGLSPDSLAPVLTALPAHSRPVALAWLEGHLTIRRLVHDVQEAGARISTLVGNVKTYSHMDRATDLAPLDVHPGLDSTLNLLGFALREKHIRVVRDYAPGLPQVLGQAGSLNQVWTNLLDNAIDALPAEGGGEITVRTRQEGDFVRVFIIDNGPGIPPDVLPRILEPFFTTKPPGEGTGLGLDIALRLVEQHGGTLEVQSAPGHTEFCVWLPT
ncbi:sensor histidine kinase [Hymenobacter weizhouensis]|uniref:sensor histidine kinase n=1 Tax=Hymenobacter sp. YIM 151500-1 TaxID=2987689 RepID=UPI002225ECAB|nr:ATP-binding protein [Hymenobacter sp. YIM 151500-1]UYZ62358.1 ATP-binding protein [Hymenobacter sp. YIM 151500-1]